MRRKKRGPKTKKGRNRFHTDWKEPKLLILYVVGDDGRPSQTWAPIIDGTLRGPDAVFALLQSYARQIGLNAADKVPLYRRRRALEVKLRRWTATRRTRWLTRTRGLLKRARVDEVIVALRELCRGRTAGKDPHAPQLLREEPSSFRLHPPWPDSGFRRGSGAVESAIRRVINLRIKGASI